MSTESLPAPFNFLLLADIHFGVHAAYPELGGLDNRRQTPRPTTDSLQNGLVNIVKTLPDQPTAILVPGDLTSIASPTEFENCVNMLHGIADGLDIPRANVLFTFGNHDTNWRIAELKSNDPKLPHDPGYERIAAEVGIRHVPTAGCLQPGPVPASGVFALGDHTVISLNSGHHCVADQSYPHGRLGKEQLDWFSSALTRLPSRPGWKILLVHHHPFAYPYPRTIPDASCIEEGAQVIDLAAKAGIDLLCHGHRHHPRLFTDMRTGWIKPLTFISAGSLGVVPSERDVGRIPNLFHLVSLTERLPNSAAFGKLTSFEYSPDGWRDVRHASGTPLDHVNWFGAAPERARMRAAIEGLLTTLLNSATNAAIHLPPRDRLPHDLRCCSLAELHEEFASAVASRGWNMSGRYPDPVLLIKPSLLWTHKASS